MIMVMFSVGSCHSSSCSLFPFFLKAKPSLWTLSWLVRSIQIKSHCLAVVCYVGVVVWYIIMAFGGVVEENCCFSFVMLWPWREKGKTGFSHDMSIKIGAKLLWRPIAQDKMLLCASFTSSCDDDGSMRLCSQAKWLYLLSSLAYFLLMLAWLVPGHEKDVEFAGWNGLRETVIKSSQVVYFNGII